MPDNYHPCYQLLADCGFHPLANSGNWCQSKPVHMHYFTYGHSIEVYNGLPHSHITLASRNEVKKLMAIPPYQGAPTISH